VLYLTGSEVDLFQSKGTALGLTFG
jgi:hypothetical protein